MLSFRRALASAAIIIALILLLRHTSSTTHTTTSSLPKHKDADFVDRTPGVSDGSMKGHSPNSATTTSTSAIAPKKDRKGTAQKTISDTSKFSLIEQLEYQFPYDVETRFPGYIWQTWKYTPASAEFDERYRPAEASWTEKHPSFIHEVITDEVAVYLMHHLYASVPDVLEAYNALPMAILKADFFRYLILLARGGIYSDIDTHALKSALEWVPLNVPRTAIGLVIGIEADPDRPDWKEWYSRRIQFCQWTIQAKPGHPVLREIVANITKETLKRKKDGTLKLITDDNVVDFSGPSIWTDTIMDYFNDEKYFDMSVSKGSISWRNFTGMTAAKKVGDTVVLPITCFSPGVQTMGAQDYDHPMAMVKHEFDGTWKPEALRHIGEIYEDGKIVPAVKPASD